MQNVGRVTNPRLTSFPCGGDADWKNIHHMMSEIRQCSIPLDPLLLLLNMTSAIADKDQERKNKGIILSMVTAARMGYATLWGKPRMPKEGEWLHTLLEAMEMERLTARMKNYKSEAINERV